MPSDSKDVRKATHAVPARCCRPCTMQAVLGTFYEGRDGVGRLGGERLVEHGPEDLWGEERDTEPVPQEGAEDGDANERHELPAELIVGEGLEVDELVEMWEGAPRTDSAAGDAREDGEEERVVLRDALHPWPSLVVDQKHSDALRRLNQEDARVEQVGHEGRGPERHCLRHVVALLGCGRLGFFLKLAQPLALEKVDHLLQLLGAHLIARHLDGGAHREEVESSLAEHGEKDGRVEQGAERPLRAYEKASCAIMSNHDEAIIWRSEAREPSSERAESTYAEMRLSSIMICCCCKAESSVQRPCRIRSTMLRTDGEREVRLALAHLGRELLDGGFLIEDVAVERLQPAALLHHLALHAAERRLHDLHVPHDPQLLAARLGRRNLLPEPLLLFGLELNLLGLEQLRLDAVGLGRLAGQLRGLQVERLLRLGLVAGSAGSNLSPLAVCVCVSVAREQSEANVGLLQRAAIVSAVAAHHHFVPVALLEHPDHLGLARRRHARKDAQVVQL
eukprot:scaffold2805_cov215-Isochrysis_galbana.AAC.2